MNSFQQDIHRVSLAISKLNFLKMNKSTWKKIYKKYDKNLLMYNPNNKIFKECLRKLN